MLENDFCNFSKTSFLAREPNEMKEVSSPFPPPLRFPLYIVQKFNILYFFFFNLSYSKRENYYDLYKKKKGLNYEL